jgi:hypothetical protein
MYPGLLCRGLMWSEIEIVELAEAANSDPRHSFRLRYQMAEDCKFDR